jgi:large subunit ribosomal protein L2
MGKRIISRRSGKGGIFEATKNAKAESSYINFDDSQKTGLLRGEISDLVNDRGRSAVLAEIIFDDGREEYVPAAEGVYVGEKIEYGSTADIKIGNVTSLENVPEGCPVFNVERRPNDGGKFARSSGSYALLVSKDTKYAYIKMPSGRQITVEKTCRATIGCASGGARKEKPFVTAGKKFHAMKGRSKRYPTVRGVAMTPVAHPHGGGQHHVGRSKSVSRHSPPGAKVGSIASKRTGRRKR